MAMATFASWLTDLLNGRNIDGDVFGEYISGSLETMEDSSQGEVEETLVEILSGCVEDEETCLSLCHEIIKRWQEHKERTKEFKTEGLPSSDPILTFPSTHVPVLTSSSSRGSAAAVGSTPGLSNSEKDRLLAEYGCESIEDDLEGAGDVSISTSSRKGADPGGFGELFGNVNRSSVVEEQRKARDKQKAAHESKVERDKQNRLAQKQKGQERKEKEKKRTQKQERRR